MKNSLASRKARLSDRSGLAGVSRVAHTPVKKIESDSIQSDSFRASLPVIITIKNDEAGVQTWKRAFEARLSFHGRKQK